MKDLVRSARQAEQAGWWWKVWVYQQDSRQGNRRFCVIHGLEIFANSGMNVTIFECETQKYTHNSEIRHYLEYLPASKPRHIYRMPQSPILSQSRNKKHTGCKIEEAMLHGGNHIISNFRLHLRPPFRKLQYLQPHFFIFLFGEEDC